MYTYDTYIKIENILKPLNNSSGAAEINVMIGATTESDGKEGLVPTPISENKNKYLKGDGTWSDIDFVKKAEQDGKGNNISDTYAKKRLYGDTIVNVGRKEGTDIGENSYSFGSRVSSTGFYSYAIGSDTISAGNYSYAEGILTKSTSVASHAEGRQTEANEIYSHAEGRETIASGECSHAEGYSNTASGECSHAEGYRNTISGNYSHAEGTNNNILGNYSHTEGNSNTVSGNYSHAEGCQNTASGYCSHAEGSETIANNYFSHSSGRFNVEMEVAPQSWLLNSTPALAIGNGDGPTTRSNAFSVMFDGKVKAASTITAETTADYAEFFEWEDENLNDEDRVGKFVTLHGDKISIATSNKDYILGIISGTPFVLGNGDCDVWTGMWLRDEFNRIIYEPAPKMEMDEETGTIKEVFDGEGNLIYEGERRKLNPNYDSSQKYISRFDRPEWSPVGMLGVLSVIQDGTCEVNGYCCCNDHGIATSCDRETLGAYRVIRKISDRVVRVVFR